MFFKFWKYNLFGEIKRRRSSNNQNEECPPHDDLSDPEEYVTSQFHEYEEISYEDPPSAPDLIPPLHHAFAMGQKPSTSKPNLSLTWILRNHQTTPTAQPPQPIKFQYKTRRKSAAEHTRDKPSAYDSASNKLRPSSEVVRTKSEPNLNADRGREKKRHKRRSVKGDRRFGYEIHDVDAFLAQASLDNPANIPVVLVRASVLYQTRLHGQQSELPLPLGSVVNAVFLNQSWLYVQTPHLEEGYVAHAACLPLGILPPQVQPRARCWETSHDVFPRPQGNVTDTEKTSQCGTTRCSRRTSSCEERSVDTLYLKAAAASASASARNIHSDYDKLYLKATANARNTGTRQTLLVVGSDYDSCDKNTVAVKKGDVVKLVSAHVKDWFWIQTRDGREGFIPAFVAGHGFL